MRWWEWNRAILQYKARPDGDAVLRGRLQQFTVKHPRWGVRKAYWTLRRDLPRFNHKRV